MLRLKFVRGTDIIHDMLVCPWNSDKTIDLSPNSQNTDPWYCISCWEEEKRKKRVNDPDPLYRHLTSTIEKVHRLGLYITEDMLDPDDDSVRKWYQKIVDKYENHLRERLPVDLFTKIKDTPPRPYPTAKPMDAVMRSKMAIHGRRFEILMVNITIESCDCCGIVVPVQKDLRLDPLQNGSALNPFNKKEKSMIKRNHCNTKLYPA